MSALRGNPIGMQDIRRQAEHQPVPLLIPGAIPDRNMAPSPRAGPARAPGAAAAHHIAVTISRHRTGLYHTTEQHLQQDVAALLASEGFAAEAQVRLGPADRLDFLVDGVAVELKVNGTAEALERQVTRYLAHDEVTAVVVVTNRARHRGLPPEINGKPVLVVFLAGRL